MSDHKVQITVNGVPGTDEIEARLLLVHYLRGVRGLTGTHVGCDTSNCGACTVMVDGLTVKSCSVLAVAVDGSEVLTVEGLAAEGELSPVQEGFRQCHGLQCGYCTPGFLTTITAGLRETPNPTRDEAREMIAGNLCRCTGYLNIIAAVLRAAELRDRQP
jgi:carbon-monoxide dehydrogenase small subunit